MRKEPPVNFGRGGYVTEKPDPYQRQRFGNMRGFDPNGPTLWRGPINDIVLAIVIAIVAIAGAVYGVNWNNGRSAVPQTTFGAPLTDADHLRFRAELANPIQVWQVLPFNTTTPVVVDRALGAAEDGKRLDEILDELNARAVFNSALRVEEEECVTIPGCRK